MRFRAVPAFCWWPVMAVMELSSTTRHTLAPAWTASVRLLKPEWKKVLSPRMPKTFRPSPCFSRALARPMGMEKPEPMQMAVSKPWKGSPTPRE